MRRKKWLFVLCGVAVGFGLFDGDGEGSIARAQEIVIIANSGVGDSELGRDMVADMFLGDRSRWNDNTKVVIATLKDGGTHERFLGDFMKKTSSQFSTYWKKQVFTGKGKMPPAFASESELVEFVGKTEGAIGYASAGAPRESVKIVSVSP